MVRIWEFFRGKMKNARKPSLSAYHTAGRVSGSLIQALRHLGQDQIDDTVIAILRRHVATSPLPTTPSSARISSMHRCGSPTCSSP